MNNKKDIDLSIIIPAFNVQDYIIDCLLSCLNQKESSLIYEIIVVNDGSSDKTEDNARKVLDTCAIQSCLVNQSNMGLSIARNNGLKTAKGKYVWFVDGDDKLASNSLTSIAPDILEGMAEAILIQMGTEINGKIVPRGFPNGDFKAIYTGVDILQMLLRQKVWTPCVPATIYKREFLRRYNLLMKADIYHEDAEFTPRAYYYLKSITICSACLYHVTVRPNSITRSFNPKRNIDLVHVAKSLSDFCHKNVSLQYKKLYSTIISILLNSSLINITSIDKRNWNVYMQAWNNVLLLHFFNSHYLKHKFCILRFVVIIFLVHVKQSLLIKKLGNN